MILKRTRAQSAARPLATAIGAGTGIDHRFRPASSPKPGDHLPQVRVVPGDDVASRAPARLHEGGVRHRDLADVADRDRAIVEQAELAAEGVLCELSGFAEIRIIWTPYRSGIGDHDRAAFGLEPAGDPLGCGL